MKQIINGVCVAFGFISLGLGVIGIILPILPTTPFLLLSAFLFAKGSQRFHKWFLRTKLYNKYIDQMVGKKEMTAETKRNALTFISVLLLVGFIFSPVWYAKVIIAVIFAGHWYYFLFKVKTAKGRKE